MPRSQVLSLELAQLQEHSANMPRKMQIWFEVAPHNERNTSRWGVVGGTYFRGCRLKDIFSQIGIEMTYLDYDGCASLIIARIQTHAAVIHRVLSKIDFQPNFSPTARLRLQAP